MNWKTWLELLDASPDDVVLRLAWSDWLEERGASNVSRTQRWLVANNKVPGPPCCSFSRAGEATWFSAAQEGVLWSFPGKTVLPCEQRVRPEWCLPVEVFNQLSGDISYFSWRVSKAHHQHARSWTSRRNAESALVQALLRANVL